MKISFKTVKIREQLELHLKTHRGSLQRSPDSLAETPIPHPAVGASASILAP